MRLLCTERHVSAEQFDRLIALARRSNADAAVLGAEVELLAGADNIDLADALRRVREAGQALGRAQGIVDVLEALR